MKLFDLFATLTLNSEKFTKELNQAHGMARKFMRNIEAEVKGAGSSLLSGISGWSKFGLTLMGGALAGLAVYSVKAATDMETGWAGVIKTTGMYGDELEKLKEQIKDTAISMRGMDIGNLQAVAQIAGQLGIKGAENISRFSKAVEMTRIATNLTAEEAASGFARLSNIMGEPITSAERMGSVINKLEDSTTALGSEILSMGVNLAPIGKTFGLTTSQVLALGAAVRDTSGQIESGITALTTLFNLMLAKPKGFASAIGITTNAFKELVETSPKEALYAFLEALRGMDKFKRSEVMKNLGVGSRRASIAITGLVEGIHKLRSAMDMGESEWIENTSLLINYNTQSKTLNSYLTTLKTRLKVAAGELGETFLPPLKTTVDKMGEFIDKVKDYIITSPAFETAIIKSGNYIEGLGNKLAGATKEDFEAFAKTLKRLAIAFGIFAGLPMAVGFLKSVAWLLLAFKDIVFFTPKVIVLITALASAFGKLWALKTLSVGALMTFGFGGLSAVLVAITAATGALVGEFVGNLKPIKKAVQNFWYDQQQIWYESLHKLGRITETEFQRQMDIIKDARRSMLEELGYLPPSPVLKEVTAAIDLEAEKIKKYKEEQKKIYKEHEKWLEKIGQGPSVYKGMNLGQIKEYIKTIRDLPKSEYISQKKRPWNYLEGQVNYEDMLKARREEMYQGRVVGSNWLARRRLESMRHYDESWERAYGQPPQIRINKERTEILLKTIINRTAAAELQGRMLNVGL